MMNSKRNVVEKNDLIEKAKKKKKKNYYFCKFLLAGDKFMPKMHL